MAETKTFSNRILSTRKGQLSNAQHLLTEVTEIHNLIGDDLLAVSDNAAEKGNDEQNADRFDRKNRRDAGSEQTSKQLRKVA